MISQASENRQKARILRSKPNNLEEQYDNIITRSISFGQTTTNQWGPDQIKESVLLDNSELLMGSNDWVISGTNSKKQIDDFLDLYTKQDQEKSVITPNNRDQNQRLFSTISKLKSQILTLTNINSILKQENEFLRKDRGISNIGVINQSPEINQVKQINNCLLKQLSLQKKIDALEKSNFQLNFELAQAQEQIRYQQDSQNRMLAQVKDIFAKQRDLIDENEKLHQIAMNYEKDIREFKTQIISSEKTNKRIQDNLQREIIFLKKKQEVNTNTTLNYESQESLKKIIGSTGNLLKQSPRGQTKETSTHLNKILGIIFEKAQNDYYVNNNTKGLPRAARKGFTVMVNHSAAVVGRMNEFL